MKSYSNVLNIGDLRKKRRAHSLRAWLRRPEVVAGLFLIGVYSLVGWAYIVDVKNNPSHGFSQAKENLERFQSSYLHK